MDGKIIILVGTRKAITIAPLDHRVVCASCGAGGVVKHRSKDAATHAAIRDSVRPCRACGAS